MAGEEAAEFHTVHGVVAARWFNKVVTFNWLKALSKKYTETPFKFEVCASMISGDINVDRTATA